MTALPPMPFNPNRRTATTAVLKLAGGFTASLTPDEANQWHEHVCTLPDWEAIEAVSRELLAAQIVYRGSAQHTQVIYLVELSEKYNEYEYKLYGHARDWYAELLRKDDEPDTKETKT